MSVDRLERGQPACGLRLIADEVRGGQRRRVRHVRPWSHPCSGRAGRALPGAGAPRLEVLGADQAGAGLLVVEDVSARSSAPRLASSGSATFPSRIGRQLQAQREPVHGRPHDRDASCRDQDPWAGCAQAQRSVAIVVEQPFIRPSARRVRIGHRARPSRAAAVLEESLDRVGKVTASGCARRRCARTAASSRPAPARCSGPRAAMPTKPAMSVRSGPIALRTRHRAARSRRRACAYAHAGRLSIASCCSPADDDSRPSDAISSVSIATLVVLRVQRRPFQLARPRLAEVPRAAPAGGPRRAA